MTPQSSFMILAPIIPAREPALCLLLASMNRDPGLAAPLNPMVPFAQFAQLHFARFVILDDLTLGDIEVYGMPRVNLPKYLAFLGDCDGSADDLLRELAKRADEGLRAVFEHCTDYSSGTELLVWMKSHNLQPAANYVNWLGRTVQQVREEEAVRQGIENYLQSNSSSIAMLRPRHIRDALKEFVATEQKAGRLPLSPPKATSLGWQIRNVLNLVGIPLVLLLVSPILLLALPFFLILLRRCECSDPEIAPRVDPPHAEQLASIEDRDVTNQFSAMGSVKPGLVRRITMLLVLGAIDYTARHLFNRGRLARVTTIQFARWVFLDGGRRVLFASNYDGSLESYMDDFINKVAFGLNAVFSNGIGYPRTNWLLLDGAKDEQTFKRYLRRHQMSTQVWYNAFPGLTALDKRRNALIREGLEKPGMTDAEIQEWLRLF